MGIRLKYGVYENSLDTAFGSTCVDFANYLKHSLNISYEEFGEISGEENDKFQSDSKFTDGYDIAFMPYSLNGGWYYIHYMYTLPIINSDMILISGSPRKIVETSFSGYFVFKTDVIIHLAFSLVTVSVLGTLIKTVLAKRIRDTSRTSKKKSKTFGITILFANQLWYHFWSFFRVPIPNILRHISYRVLTWAWLVLVIFVAAQLNGSFTARISKLFYDSVDTFDDIKTELHVSRDSFEHNTIRFKAKEDEVVRNLLGEVEYNEYFYSFTSLLFDEDFLKRVNDSEITIVSNTFLFRIFANFKREDENWRLYISPSLAPLIQGIIVSNNVSLSIKESINIRIAWIFERKTYDHIMLESDRYAKLHMWRETTNDSEVYPLTINDMYAGIAQFIASTIIAMACLLVETSSRLKMARFLRKRKVKSAKVDKNKLFTRAHGYGKRQRRRIRIEFEIETYHNLYYL